MRWIAGLMLGGAALLGGCLQPGAVFCENGAICLEGQACTENATSLCDTEHAVAECYGAGKFDGLTCTTEPGGLGLCTAGACVPCAPELLECAATGWREMQSMAVEQLTAIHVARQRLAHVVGFGSTVLRYDGVGWMRIEGPRESSALVDLVGVWGSDTELLVLSTVGDIYRRTGSTWIKTTPGPGVYLNALWGRSNTSLYAGGFEARLGLFDGTTWSWVSDPQGTVLEPSSPYNAIWGTTTDVIAAGANGLISHHDGNNAWSQALTSGLDAYNFFAVGGGGGKIFAGGTASGQVAIAELTSNRTWAEGTISSTVAGTIRGIVVAGATDGYAVAGDGLVLHYDGTSWSEMPSIATTHDLFGIALMEWTAAMESTMGRTLIAVGEGGTIWRYDLP